MTKQIIEGKVLEMELEPRNIQVAIQGTDENSFLLSINENEVIKTIEPVCDIHEHLGSQPVHTILSETRVSALRDSDGELTEVKQRLKCKVSSCKECKNCCTKHRLLSKRAERN